MYCNLISGKSEEEKKTWYDTSIWTKLKTLTILWCTHYEKLMHKTQNKSRKLAKYGYNATGQWKEMYRESNWQPRKAISYTFTLSLEIKLKYKTIWRRYGREWNMTLVTLYLTNSLLTLYYLPFRYRNWGNSKNIAWKQKWNFRTTWNRHFTIRANY